MKQTIKLTNKLVNQFPSLQPWAVKAYIKRQEKIEQRIIELKKLMDRQHEKAVEALKQI